MKLKTQQAIVVNDLVIQGSTADQTSLLTTGQSFVVQDRVVADNYGEDVLWTTGEGGLTTFTYGFIHSDQDIWVQLRNDDTGAAEYLRMFVPKNVIFTLPNKGAGNTTDAFDGAILVANTDYANIDRIEVMRDAVDEAGDATVSLYLFD